MSERDIVQRLLVRAHQLPRAPVRLDRVFDMAGAALALVFLAPLLILVSLLLVVEGRGPVIFAHPRIGRGGRVFKVLKFRSMVTDGDSVLREHLAASPRAAAEWAADHKLRDDPRVTRLGGFLRKTSLDELPQFWNVLCGDMSIVGPRPIVEAEVSRYGRFFSAYCSIRPGITGVWQVSGRNDITYRRRVAMDALYARRKSVLLDIEIIMATVPAVLARKGSY